MFSMLEIKVSNFFYAPDILMENNVIGAGHRCVLIQNILYF